MIGGARGFRHGGGGGAGGGLEAFGGGGGLVDGTGVGEDGLVQLVIGELDLGAGGGGSLLGGGLAVGPQGQGHVDLAELVLDGDHEHRARAGGRGRRGSRILGRGEEGQQKEEEEFHGERAFVRPLTPGKISTPAESGHHTGRNA